MAGSEETHHVTWSSIKELLKHVSCFDFAKGLGRVSMEWRNVQDELPRITKLTDHLRIDDQGRNL